MLSRLRWPRAKVLVLGVLALCELVIVAKIGAAVFQFKGVKRGSDGVLLLPADSASGLRVRSADRRRNANASGGGLHGSFGFSAAVDGNAGYARSLNSVHPSVGLKVGGGGEPVKDEESTPFQVPMKDLVLAPDSQKRLQNVSAESVAAARKILNEVKMRPDAKMLVVVMSAYQNIYSRRFIRTSWGDPSLQKELGFQVVFLVGRGPPRSRYNAHVKTERLRRKDMLMVDFVDSYRNLTLKSLALMYFVRDRVVGRSGVKVVAKVDDDVVVDPFALIDLVWRIPKPTEEFLCRVNNNGVPKRSRASKWYVSYSDWPTNSTFPPYCDGPAYLFRPAVAEKILAAFEAVVPRPFFWLEDVFVTGVLAELASVGHVPLLSPPEAMSSKPLESAPAALTHFGFHQGQAKKRDEWKRMLRQHRNN